MHALPVFKYQIAFTATGTKNSFTDNTPADQKPTPMVVCPHKWAMQVTGYDANGNRQAAGAWEVTLQGSLDGTAYDSDAGAMLNHKSGTNADGDSVRSSGSLLVTNFVQIHCKTLTLGSAAKIVVTVIGVV